LFDWVVADDYVLSSDVAPSGKELVVNRLKTDGVSICSELEIIDMKSDPFATIDSDGDDVFLSAFYLDDNTLAAVTENTLSLYSEPGALLLRDNFESVAAFCEFPQKKAVAAVRRNNRALLMEYEANEPKGRVIAMADKPVKNMTADNGYLFVNYGDEVLVLNEKGKAASRLILDAEALYGGASNKIGVLVVTKKDALVFEI
jgi:hypothetical protein